MAFRTDPIIFVTSFYKIAGWLYETATFDYEINMKTKDAFKSTGKYLRELSIVVVGIAITFSISNWISYRNEQKNLERYLEMVKMELEDNLKIVQDQFDFYDRTGTFAKYLYFSGKQENVQADSLAKYYDVMRDLKYMIYQTSAFEMLKSSGSMRLIKDKKQLKSIMDCYNLLERAKNRGEKEMNLKENVLHSIIEENGANEQVFDLRKPENKRLFNHFSIYTASEGNFRDGVEQIKKTLSMF